MARRRSHACARFNLPGRRSLRGRAKADFRGPVWNYLGLEVEIPSAGDYITGHVGDTPVIVVRTAEGGINALVNRCAHKGSMIYYRPSGHMSELTCPYHNWVYDFAGNLKSVAFRHGVRGQGGMPAGVTCGFASAPSCSTHHQLTPCW
ncbi:MAG TPA: Rieske 2Fe-2S domain-containing protein [Stellaceae bacterium]|nr:Rieske 2Fe-2S domain-containing protein [Stellaceae bacterium]